MVLGAVSHVQVAFLQDDARTTLQPPAASMTESLRPSCATSHALCYTHSHGPRCREPRPGGISPGRCAYHPAAASGVDGRKLAPLVRHFSRAVLHTFTWS